MVSFEGFVFVRRTIPHPHQSGQLILISGVTPAMMTVLTSEQIREFKKKFDLFVVDPENPESIEKSSFIKLVRTLGMNPTKKEAAAMLAQSAAKDGKYLSLSEFCKIMEKWYKTLDEVKEDLRRAFTKFDVSGDGWISRDDLRTVLHDIGQEVMTTEEIEDIIQRTVNTRENRCYYEGNRWHYCYAISYALSMRAQLRKILKKSGF
ncbi:hypothetical protein LSH36_303g02027 [Paralvinella palmiformis]|uniref:EF-hand domain-containing protein n=1 Tax=Paralvinella palmiformis TaxID=53620 RepID=A0AAD9N127_9ANNE|nr:hypothetical protein LSH36_303g02027 [Paralvinella palmiformis]